MRIASAQCGTSPAAVAVTVAVVTVAVVAVAAVAVAAMVTVAVVMGTPIKPLTLTRTLTQTQIQTPGTICTTRAVQEMMEIALGKE